MSESLRDALEKLVQEWHGSEPTEALYDALSELLAAHPVEPAPVASRERVAEATSEDWVRATAKMVGFDAEVADAAVARLGAAVLPKSGAELSAASIQAHMAKRRECPDYGLGDHDCSEHGGG